MSWPSVVMWLLIIVSALVRGPALLYVFAFSGAFGTLQMLPGDSAGGVNLLPQSLAAVFATMKIILARGNIMRGLALGLDVSRIGLFTFYVVYALFSAMVLPRLFAGQIAIVPIAGDVNGVSILHPNSGNYTQPAYILLTYLTVLCFAIIGDNETFKRRYLTAVLVFGATMVATGMADLVTYYTGLGDLLDPFRTVTYELLTDVEAAGSKRVVGLMPEASAFGPLCVSLLSMLVFLRPCFTPKIRQTVVPLTILALLAMVALSTSTSAYAGAGVFAACFAANWVFRYRSKVALCKGDLKIEGLVIATAILMAGATILLLPHVLDPFSDLFDKIVLEKASSQSFIQRNMWTLTGWQAFLDTGGVGVGLGSVRTSNWFVSILASTGVAGAAVLFGFLVYLLCRPLTGTAPFDREMARGLRFSLVPVLVMFFFGGTIPDIGVWVASIFGFLQTITVPKQQPFDADAQPTGRITAADAGVDLLSTTV